MYILDKIVAHKKMEVADRKRNAPETTLKEAPLYLRKPISLANVLRSPGASGIIAEFKRQSPSKGEIRPGASPLTITTAYARAGASGLSVLTDASFFGGSTEDFLEARSVNQIPMLRKEFIVDPYQLTEAKAMGADVVLLIAECLERNEVADFAAQAKELEMEVLLEIHTPEQIDKYTTDIDLIGVNNRNLKTFEVSAAHSINLFSALPEAPVKVAESGLSDVATIHQLYEIGYRGFLIGEWFMRQEDPGKACGALIEHLIELRNGK